MPISLLFLIPSSYKADGNQKLALTQLHLRRSAVAYKDQLAGSLCGLTEAYEKMQGAADTALIKGNQCNLFKHYVKQV